ncbi:FAD-dependent oxidoreductase, partial [bacterium]|nr:FAD-dependent oxidoreductase [bacterium]
TKNAIVARQQGMKGDYHESENDRRTLEFISVAEPTYSQLDLPAPLGTFNGPLRLHPGASAKGHCYVEYMVSRSADPLASEVEARKQSIRLCEHLLANEPAFKQAVLTQASPELFGFYSWRVAKPLERNNLFITSNQTRHPFPVDGGLLANLELEAIRIAQKAIEKARKIQPPSIQPTTHVSTMQEKLPIKAYRPEQAYDHRLDLSFYNLTHAPVDSIPKDVPTQLLVVGGGTAGACAAIAASRQASHVTVVEPLHGLGGTGTLGGINKYYHGYRGGFTRELDEAVQAMNQRISTPVPTSQCNVEAKMMTYLEEITKNNARILFQTLAVFPLMEKNKVTGALIATPDGLRKISADVTIDATGDGDLAARAGAKAYLGSETDGNLQTCNLCNWHIGKQMNGVNIDIAVVDNTNPADITRGVLAGHQRNGNYDFSPYLSMRESRHVMGDYKLRLEDVFTQRRFPDTIAIGQTDYDQHGLQNSDLARMGFLPYHRDEKIVRVPYRACLPKGIDGLYVIGKAFSAQSDAFCFMRMQPDLQNMGYAIGSAAAMAAETNQPIREIPINKLQKHLLTMKIIKQDDLPSPKHETVDLDPLMQSLKKGEEQSLLPALCAAKKEILPRLETAYTQAAESEKPLLAMALAWHGSATGVDTLIQQLTVLKEKPQGSELDGAKRPRGGYVGEPSTYWRVNQLIVLLGRIKAKRAIGLISEITKNTDAGGPPQSHARLHWRRVPSYDRIISLCHCLERIPDPQAAPPLEALLNKPHIGGHVAREGLTGNQNYSSAYLELVIARTLAHCGGKTGLKTLAAYVEDIRSTLSDHALEVLQTITGRQIGKNSEAWKNALL